MADDPGSERSYSLPFDKPEAVAVALADGLISYALTIAKSDQTLAIEAFTRLTPHVLQMLASLDITENDYKRVEDLLAKAAATLREAVFRAPPSPSRSKH